VLGRKRRHDAADFRQPLKRENTSAIRKSSIRPR